MAAQKTSVKSKEFQAGQIIAKRYQIEGFLAEGGMGAIYIARDKHSQVRVAVKCLYAVYNGNEIVRTRFMDEARIQMMLQHPNIARVYEIVEDPSLAFVMEYVEGCTLEERLKEAGTLSTEEILAIMVPVLSGIGLAHSQGIIHRDLKPSNILLKTTTQIEQPKIMDFGVAKLNRNKDLTATGTTVGTLHYMSPEQILGSKSIDGRADIYSLGITLYKLCTGKVPFNAATEFSLMMAQVKEEPEPPSKHNPSITPALERIIMRAIRKKPEDRYQNIKEFTSALAKLKVGTGTATLETLSLPDFIIDYAMGADEVAVDKTEQVLLRSRRLYESGFFEQYAVDRQQNQPNDPYGSEPTILSELLLEETDADAPPTQKLDPVVVHSIHQEDNDTYDLDRDRTLQSKFDISTFDAQRTQTSGDKTTNHLVFKKEKLNSLAAPVRSPLGSNSFPPKEGGPPSHGTHPPQARQPRPTPRLPMHKVPPPKYVGPNNADTKDRTKPMSLKSAKPMLHELEQNAHLSMDELNTLPLDLPDSSSEWANRPMPAPYVENPPEDPVGRVLKAILVVLLLLVVVLMGLIVTQAF